MDGYILLTDGTRLDGQWTGPEKTVVGWLAANTGVVGFQEMVTDPAYKGRILAFTYPEIGNVGVTEAFAESGAVQVHGLVVKVLSDYTSHYRCEDRLDNLLAKWDVPCLTDVDTRGLAVHVREHGEMPGAIAPAGADPESVRRALGSAKRRSFEPTDAPPAPEGGSGPTVAVLDLGVRRSQLGQLSRVCRPVLFAHDATRDAILEAQPAGVFVSDGPGDVPPPDRAIETIGGLVGRVPVLGCGLGHLTLGVALGCKVGYLPRGHHGANQPVRFAGNGHAEVTQQRHTAVLDHDSVVNNPKVELLCENMNDQSVEGIRSAGGDALGLQSILAAPLPGEANAHIATFIQGLGER